MIRLESIAWVVSIIPSGDILKDQMSNPFNHEPNEPLDQYASSVRDRMADCVYDNVGAILAALASIGAAFVGQRDLNLDESHLQKKTQQTVACDSSLERSKWSRISPPDNIDRNRSVIDTIEFKRRLAAGEFDDAVRRLLGEMDSLDEPESSANELSVSMQDVLDRGRLLGRSTLCRLNPVGTVSSISSSGRHSVTPQFASDQPTSAGFTINVKDDGNASLSGEFPAGWQPLDLVAVVPQIKRNQLFKRLSIDSTIVTPLNEPPHQSGRVPAVTVLSLPTLPGGGSGSAAVPKPLPTFEIAFDSLESRLRISTPLQPGDGDGLLVLTAVESEPPAAVILERSGDTPQLVGYCDLPTSMHGAGRIKVKVSSIDLDRLSELSPEAASLWLATQPMIALPLTRRGCEYSFFLYASAREFLKQHPSAILAVRVASHGMGVAE